MKYLSLSINGTPIPAPEGVRTGGMDIGQKIISTGINLVFLGGILFAIILIIYSGIQWTLSGGDKEKIASARNRITFIIIGLIVIILAFVIVKAILTLIGYNSSFFFIF